MRKALIIEPHSDDAMLGMGGFMERFRETYDFHSVLVTASTLKLNQVGEISREVRLAEYMSYCAYYHINWLHEEFEPMDAEGHLYENEMYELVGKIEQVVKYLQPDLIFAAAPSFHHDHRTIFNAMNAVIRPSGICPDVSLMTYENSVDRTYRSDPDVYVKLSADAIEEKVSAFAHLFPSQDRLGSYVSQQYIRQLASYRGLEIAADYAEAFTNIRGVI